MPSRTFFTVVIPTHNRSKFLKVAIQSVLNQTFKNFELIVVDDHSTDDTKQVVSQFFDMPFSIRYVINDHTKGGAGARNAGIFRAKGEWVAFLDDDDVWLPNKLELQHRKIQEIDDSVCLIYTGYATYDFGKMYEIFVYVPHKAGWIQNDLLCKNYIGTLSTVAIRSKLLRQIGGLDERFKAMQDIDLYVEIAGLAKIVFVSRKLAHVRVAHVDRISLKPHIKLASSKLFWNKYDPLINQNLRIRHCVASRVFIYSLQTKNWQSMFKALPLTFCGCLIDMHNMRRVLRHAISLIYRKMIIAKLP
jgi:glycosyltransferase involved in cell wall biosynthesis